MSDSSTNSAQKELAYNEVAKLVPLSMAIVATNLLVVVLFWKRRYLQTLSNFPLLSLAVCDFATGFVNIPLLIIFMLIPTMEIDNPRGLISNLSYSMLVTHAFTSTATVYHILLVITDKYFAIKWPLKHRLLTKKKMSASLAVVWLLSFVIALIPVSWINVSQKPIGRKLMVGYGICCLVFVFLFSYLFMVYALVVMFRIISEKTKQKDSTLLRRNSRNMEVTKNKRRVSIIFAVMATVFAVCWLPWFMLTFLVNLRVQIENLEYFMEWFIPFRYVTSIINPLLYTFFKLDFRQAFKETVWNKIVCKPSFNARATIMKWRRRSFRLRENNGTKKNKKAIYVVGRGNDTNSVSNSYVHYVSSVWTTYAGQEM